VNDKERAILKEALEKCRLDKLESDILTWGKYYFPEKFTLPFCYELHNYFIEIMNEDYTSTLAPRGTAKTTIKCFLIPLYLALVYPRLYRHYLNVQATTSKAISINISIKSECEENEKLIRDYGVFNRNGIKTLVSDGKWTEKQFVLPNGVVFSCLGAGESVRGINYRTMRPDYIIIDDLYDEDDINNVRAIQKKEAWFWGALYPARAAHKKHCIHVQGTAIHKVDLMHNLSKKPRWKFKKFQAIKSFDTQEVLWRENPAKTFDALMLERSEMGSIIFEREMQNNCRDDETAIIKESWLKFYKHSLFTRRGLKMKIKIAGLDPACGEKQLNDFSGYAIIHVTDNFDVYIENVLEEKNSFNANLNAISSWNDRYKPDVFAIEAISGFKMLSGEVRRTQNVKLKEITAVKDKIVRLEAQSFRFENGKVFINEEMSEKNKNTLIDQLINNYPEHDDVRDAVIICMEQIETKKKVGGRLA